MPLEDIITVNISRETFSPRVTGFNRVLILGGSGRFDDADLVRLYSSADGLDAMLADGFLTTDPEYRAASALLKGQRKPDDFLIGERSTPVTQLVTVSVDGDESNGTYTVTINGVAHAYIASGKTATQIKDALVAAINAAVAQVHLVAVDGNESDGNYTVTINGTPFTFAASSNTATEIKDGLVTLINAGSQPVTAASTGADTFSLTADVAGTAFTVTIASPSADMTLTASVANSPEAVGVTATSTGSDTFTLTADNPSEGFTYAVSSPSSDLSAVLTTPNVSVADDLLAIKASTDLGDTFFGLILTSTAEWDVQDASDYCETRHKLFGFQTDDEDALDGEGFFADLAASAPALTQGFWSEDLDNWPIATWMGEQLTYTPGQNTWELKNLPGVTPTSDTVLTATAKANLAGINLTYYIDIGGQGVTQGAKVMAGEWIDIIVGVEWVRARMMENFYARLVKLPKLPFTSEGIAQAATWISEILSQATENGLFAPRDEDGKSFLITIPKASDFTPEQKQTRRLTGVSWVGFLAGAIHKGTVTGIVTN